MMIALCLDSLSGSNHSRASKNLFLHDAPDNLYQFLRAISIRSLQTINFNPSQIYFSYVQRNTVKQLHKQVLQTYEGHQKNRKKCQQSYWLLNKHDTNYTVQKGAEKRDPRRIYKRESKERKEGKDKERKNDGS